MRLGGALAVLAGSLLGTAVAGAQPVRPLLDSLVPVDVMSSDEFAIELDATELLRTLPDPADDVIHSTGAATGFTPGFNEFTGVTLGRIEIAEEVRGSDQFAAYAAAQPDGHWCADMGFGTSSSLHTACPSGNTGPWSASSSAGDLYVEWQLQGDLPIMPPGRCEFVVWGFNPNRGTPFGPIGDPNPYPFDPALGTNEAIGMGINPDGERGTFALTHSGSGGFENADTGANFAWMGDRVAGIIPGDEVSAWTHIRPYTFCSGDGYDYAPEKSGGDSTELLELNLSELPSMVYQIGEPVAPTTTTSSTTSSTTTTTLEEESTPPTSIVETDSETGTNYVGWWITGTLILFVGGGVYFVARWNNPCIPLKGRWMQAKKACEEAQRRADERRASLREAQQGLQDALDQMREQDAKADAQREQLAQMERARRSSMESGGITFHRIPEGLLTSEGLDSIIETLSQQIASHEQAIQSWKDSVESWEQIVKDQERHVAEAEAAAKEKCAAAAAAKKAYEDCIKAASAPAPSGGGEAPGEPASGGEGSGTAAPPPTGPASGGGTAPGGSGPGVSTGGEPEPESESQPACEEGQTQQEELSRTSFTVPATTGSLVISIDPPTEEFAEWMAGQMSGGDGWFAPSHLNDPGLAGAIRETLRGLDTGMSVAHSVRIEIPRREITYACIQHWVCRSGQWVKSHTERREVARKGLAPIVLEESGKTDSARVAQMIVQAQRQHQRLVQEDESISSFCPGS